MFQTNTSNFNPTNSKYLSISNYQDFPVIKFTRMKKEKPSHLGNLEKTNNNASNINAGKNLNNMSTYYSSSSYPDLVLTNSTNKNFLESKKNFTLSTLYKTKEESLIGFFPKNRFLNCIKKADLDNEKTERNEKSEKDKSTEKYHIKSLEFNGHDRTRSNLNLNTTQISNFFSPSGRFNNNNTNNYNWYNNNNSQQFRENLNSNCNNINTNQNNQSFLYSINVTNNGFNTTQTHVSCRNNASKPNITTNNNKVNFGTNTILSSYQRDNKFNCEFKSVHSGATTSRFGKNQEFINYAKNKNSPNSNYNNCITSNNNFSKFQNLSNTNNNNEVNYNNQSEIEDLRNLKLRNTYNSRVFKSFNKFTKTQHSPSNAFSNKSKEKKKVINLSDFDQFEIYKEKYMKMREEQFLKDTAYFIYDKYNQKKFKKFIFKEIPTNESFKEIIDKITRLVEIKRNNNEFISVEYILNMLREEIENNSITPLRMKNEDFMLPLINKKSEHAALEFESGLNERRLFQRLKRSKNKLNKNNKSNSMSNHLNNKYFASCISEEVEHYWEKRNGRNDESIATNLLNKDRLRLMGEKYIIKSKKVKGKKKKVKSRNKNSGSIYTDSSTEYYETESELTNSFDPKGNKNNRKKRRYTAGGGEISENSLSENENNESYMDQDLSELERKRRRRRRKDKYANLPRTSDIGSKFIGNLEVNLEKEIKFLNTQKNFFMKSLDSFLITQSSGFDGVSDNMLRRTLSILDKYGKKRNKKKKEGDLEDKEAMGSQQTEFVGIKSKENFDNSNHNNTKENFVTLNTNQNISSVRNSNFNNFNSKGVGNLRNKNREGAASPSKSPRKKLNLKDLKRKKSDANENNKIVINNDSEINKNAETDGKITLLSSESADLLNTEGKFTESNNYNGLLGHLNADLVTDGNAKPKKTRKRVVKRLKEGCAEGADEYEEVEIEETDPDQEALEDVEKAETDQNLIKDMDVDQVDIGNFKKFMMESLFSGPPASDNNQDKTSENEGEGVANAGRKNKKKKRNLSIENAEIIDEFSNESDYYDEESSEDQIEEYIETEEYLNTETGEIEVKHVKKTRKKKTNEENKGEDAKENEQGKRGRKKKKDGNEAICNPQLDMLLKMIQDEENKKAVERPEQTIRVRRQLKKKTLLLEPVEGLLIANNEEEIPEEEYEEVESDDTTESEKNRREEQLRIERERNEMMKKRMSESDMARYQDLLEKIESLKNLDPGNYMKNIKMLLEEFKREEQEIHELKKIERRINEFKYDLSEDRYRVNLARETKMSSLRMRDRTFNIIEDYDVRRVPE